jgi:hypothetical protein
MPPSLIKIVGPEFPVEFIANEHMKDSDHDGVGDSEDRPSFPPTCRVVYQQLAGNSPAL